QRWVCWKGMKSDWICILPGNREDELQTSAPGICDSRIRQASTHDLARHMAPVQQSLAQRLTELDAVAFRRFHKKLAQPPRLVGDRLFDRHLACNVLLVQVINALAIYIREP